MENDIIFQQYKQAVDESSIVSKTDRKGIITYANDKFCEISGYTRDELLGKNHNISRHPDMPASSFQSMWETILGGNVWQGSIKNRKKNGESYYVSTTISPIRDSSGEIQEFISIRYEITDKVKAEELVEQYQTDRLTGLPNRNRLREDLKELPGESMLIFIDIDNFSLINDLYGEPVGDEVLRYTGSELKKLIFDQWAKLYRLHGDLFAILVVDPKLFTQYHYLIQYSLLSGESKHGNIENNFVIDYTAGISYGDKELFHHASIALKNAKIKGESLVVYNKSLDLERIQHDNMMRLKAFKNALQEGNIFPYFQPIVDARDGKVVKYEAVARLMNEAGEVISPIMFLDVSKQSKLYQYFTRQVMQQVFYVVAKNPEVGISMNLDYEDIACEETVKYIQNRLETYRDYKITFEIVESEEIVDYTVIEKFIAMVKNYSCEISIDDFGSGYSNFAYLFKLEKDYLKIDGSIIQKIEEDSDAQNVVKMLVDFARINQIKTVAEFVSSKGIAQKATEMGIDYLQGYYYGEPRPAVFYGLKV